MGPPPPPHSHSKRKSAASLAMEGGGERVGVSISQTKMGHLSSMRFCLILFASWECCFAVGYKHFQACL